MWSKTLLFENIPVKWICYYFGAKAKDTKKMDNKAYIIDEGATKGRVHLEDKM